MALGLAVATLPTRSWAQSEHLPPEVLKEIVASREACGSRKPQIEAGFLTSFDVNGDGTPDYVLNYSHFRCGDAQSFCKPEGCRLQIFVSMKDGKLEKAVEEEVWSVDVNRRKGRSSLVLGLHGPACGLQSDARCKVTFVWNGTEFVKTPRPRVP